MNADCVADRQRATVVTPLLDIPLRIDTPAKLW